MSPPLPSDNRHINCNFSYRLNSYIRIFRLLHIGYQQSGDPVSDHPNNLCQMAYLLPAYATTCRRGFVGTKGILRHDLLSYGRLTRFNDRFLNIPLHIRSCQPPNRPERPAPFCATRQNSKNRPNPLKIPLRGEGERINCKICIYPNNTFHLVHLDYST